MTGDLAARERKQPRVRGSARYNLVGAVGGAGAQEGGAVHRKTLTRSSTTVATLTVVLVGTILTAGQAQAEPAPGVRSNMGLCSSYLAGLPAPVFPPAGPEPLGGNARSGVNLIVTEYGWMLADRPSSPGELYRVRARQHPTAPAELECQQRRQP